AINDSEKYCMSDFFDDFLLFDRAYELYFIDGELCELTDLSPAIQEYKALEDSLKHKFEKTREIAVKYLQYEYGNYKWG
ncbi:MAG: hypothetical protein K2J36_06340, partial [Ruminococcus sp.]|nr:hypothetical protein [Ruminococcus sp.]